MGIVVATVFAAAALVGHSRSEGRSRFEVVGDRVQITIELLQLDLPELCEVDLSLTDQDRRRQEEQRLHQCVERGLPRWLRLQTLEGSCSVVSTGVRRGEGLAVFMDGVATCPPLPGQTLMIDWGLFAGQRLDHVSTTTVVVAPGVEERALLSRRQNRLKAHIPRALPMPAIMAGIAALVVALAALGVRRRRSKTAAMPSTTPTAGGAP
jgi:hypothetical protein